MTTAIVPAGNESTRFASSMKRFTANHAYKTGDLRKINTVFLLSVRTKFKEIINTSATI